MIDMNMYMRCYNCKGKEKYVLSRISLIFLSDLHENYMTGIFTPFVDVEKENYIQSHTTNEWQHKISP